MNIVVFGITHKNSNISLREKVSFSKSKLQKAYNLLKENSFIEEVVIISTCNRSEIVARVNDISQGEEELKNFYMDFFELNKEEIEGQYLYKTQREAIRYLYEVCCGLDSLVLGEDQILGQIKEAHDIAKDLKACGKILNKLFIEAVTAAKEIKTKSRISQKPLSISYIAVKQIQKQLGSLENKKALIIGFGDMSRLALENLLDKGLKEVYLCNRKKEKLDAFIKKHSNLKYIEFDKKYQILKEVDIIISATSAPHYIYHKEEFLKHYQKTKPLCIVDIALPRDIDPDIGKLKGIALFHIDQLKGIANENLEIRRSLIMEIKNQLEISIKKYEDWYRCLPIYPKIEAIKNYSQLVTQEELDKIFKKLSHINQQDKETIEIFVKSLVKKMWRRPILQLKEAGLKGKAQEMASFVDEFLGL